MHTNKDEEDPNGKFQGGLKPKPKLWLKAKEKGVRKELKGCCSLSKEIT
jgi:hypothetical protein